MQYFQVNNVEFIKKKIMQMAMKKWKTGQVQYNKMGKVTKEKALLMKDKQV